MKTSKFGIIQLFVDFEIIKFIVYERAVGAIQIGTMPPKECLHTQRERTSKKVAYL